MNQEILERAIKLAIDGGYRFATYHVKPTGDEPNWSEVVVKFVQNKMYFNHDFAKALWGEGDEQLGQATLWKWHLANMVIADDPIKYLGDNLPKTIKGVQ